MLNTSFQKLFFVSQQNRIQSNLFKEEFGLRAGTERVPARFPTTYHPFTRENLTHRRISKPDRIIWHALKWHCCLPLHLSPSLSPPISSRGAELAQMRDTLKNKLLIWDWVDSDGWPVLKGTAENGAVGSAYCTGYKALMFPLIGHFLNQKAVATRVWANIHSFFFILPANIFIHWSWRVDLHQQWNKMDRLGRLLTGKDPNIYSLSEATRIIRYKF